MELQNNMHLLNENNAEVIESIGGEKLNINWAAYERIEKAGALKVLAVFNEATMIGYSVFMISNSLHNKDIKVAMNDVIFIEKKQRKGLLGMRLVKESEKFLLTLGINKISWFYKANSPLEKILLRLGYCNDDCVMSKKIKR
jgi:hypothetical protein